MREQQALRSVAAIVISIWTGGAAAGAVNATQAFWITVAGGAAAGAVQTGTAKGALTGAFSAALFFGIGEKFGHFTHSFEKTIAHGMAGGVMAELQGGNFGHGFASAAFSEAMSPVLKGIDNDFTRGIAHAVVGGTASELSGGKFANGAVTAAFGYAFNRMAGGGAGAETFPDGAEAGSELSASELIDEVMFTSDMEDVGLNIVYFDYGTSSDSLYDQVVMVIDRNANVHWRGNGSSRPNPGANPAYPQVSTGTYTYSPGDHYERRQDRRVPALWVNNNRSISTTTTNARHPAQGATANHIHIHWGYSPTSRGSAGCFTIAPAQWEGFINQFGQTSETVSVP